MTFDIDHIGHIVPCYRDSYLIHLMAVRMVKNDEYVSVNISLVTW